MPPATSPVASIADLPEGLPDIVELPSLTASSRGLFETLLPGVLAQAPYLVRCSSPLIDGVHQIVAAYPIGQLVERAGKGLALGDADLDPATTVLSKRADSVLPQEQFSGATLTQFRQALRAINRNSVFARFEVDRLTYWEVPGPPHALPRRQQAASQVRESLCGDLALLQAAGLLAADSLTLIDDIVAHPRLLDRATPRGVYCLVVRAQGDGATVTLPGMLILTLQPAGHAPAQGKYVVDRQAQTGETVVYCTGYFGFIQRHDHLEQALAALAKSLRDDGPLLLAILSRLAPEDQAVILRERAREGGGFEVLAQPLDDNPFETLAEQQIEAWRQGALADASGLWQPRIGLDTSRAKVLRELQAFEEQRQALRGQLSAGLRNLSQARQALLEATTLQLLEQQAQADAYWEELPSFEAYASKRIRGALLAEGIHAEPSEILVEVTITEYSPEPLDPELPPGGLPDRWPVSTTLAQYTLFEYIALRLEARAGDWSVTFSGLPAAQAERLSLKRLAELAESLDLQEGYQALLATKLQAPADAADAVRFEQGKAAAVKVFETRLRLDALLANANGDLDDSGYQAVLDVLDHPSLDTRPLRDGQQVQVEGLSLMGNSLRDVFVFHESGESSILCYLPGYPLGGPFKRHTSRGALRSALTRDLAGIEQMKDWNPQVRYWVSRFGRHQLAIVQPLLFSLARGGAGAALALRPLKGSLGQATFSYRIAYLRAEGDSLALSDAELALEKGLDIAVLVFRLLSTLIPARVMTALDLAELGYYLFTSHSSFAAGQREQAGEYLLEALTSVNGLANAKFFTFRRHAKGNAPTRLQAAGAGYTLAAIAPEPKVITGLRRIEQGLREGLWVSEGGLYVKLADGGCYRVYELANPVERTSSFHLGEGDTPLSRSLFSNPDPRIVRDPYTGNWHVLRRAGLLGGMDLPLRPVVQADRVTRGIRREIVEGRTQYRIDEGQQVVKVEFDLQHGCWYSDQTRRYYRFDSEAGRQIGSSDAGAVANHVERQEAREALGCTQPKPVLRQWQAVAGGEAVPSDIHQVWIGDYQTLSREHGALLTKNAEVAKRSGYKLHVHLLGTVDSGWNRFKLNRKYPDIEFRSLASNSFFNVFLNSEAGKVFSFFRETPSRNLAAACDVLRYRLLHELGGVYMDIDDQLIGNLPVIRLQPGQLGTGGFVEHRQLGLRGPNNSHFASLKGNPLLDAMLEEIPRCFKNSSLGRQVPRPLQGDYQRFSAYMREISEVTGPVMFNRIRHLASADAQTLTRALSYADELIVKGVRVETEVLDWITMASPVLSPLEGLIKIGNAHSWTSGRR
ncbi:dermonecrotic toxin domain-containing protein [Pseudomonas sp. microsymbiont 2]